MISAQTIGAATIDGLAYIGGLARLSAKAVRALFQDVFSPRRLAYGRAVHQSTAVGIGALPILSLISFFIGTILALQAAYELRKFGALQFVASAVAISVSRELGPLMTAILVIGRSGSSFAAELGTMRVNEEIDALSTMGISPFEFLVLPRMLGLILMMPVLTIYANLVGILGGAVVGVGMLKVGLIPYWNHTLNAVTLADFAAGLIKSVIFGVLIAIAGCMRGMQSGRSSAAVGLAATSAVVTGIVFIIVSDAILTVVYDAIGF